MLFEVERRRVIFEGKPDRRIYNPLGAVHGGYAATLHDSVCGIATRCALGPDRGHATLELKVSYLRALTEDLQMLSSGAMGGTISGAISRALGAGDYQLAQSLTLCAVVIGLVLGLALSVTVRIGGPAAYVLLGGSGEVLREAIAYSNVAALAIVFIWTTNMLASIPRGSGIMTVPAWTILRAGVGQVLVGGTLGLGLGPAPRLGMAGVAMGQLVAFTGAALVLLVHLRSTSARLRMRFGPGLHHAQRSAPRNVRRHASRGWT